MARAKPKPAYTEICQAFVRYHLESRWLADKQKNSEFVQDTALQQLKNTLHLYGLYDKIDWSSEK